MATRSDLSKVLSDALTHRGSRTLRAMIETTEPAPAKRGPYKKQSADDASTVDQ
jgi:hypothetical protein